MNRLRGNCARPLRMRQGVLGLAVGWLLLGGSLAILPGLASAQDGLNKQTSLDKGADGTRGTADESAPAAPTESGGTAPPAPRDAGAASSTTPDSVTAPPAPTTTPGSASASTTIPGSANTGPSSGPDTSGPPRPRQ
jgi:hypothetical protein